MTFDSFDEHISACALSDPAMVEKVTDVLCRILCPQKSPRPFSTRPKPSPAAAKGGYRC